jgi:hypothetical protein
MQFSADVDKKQLLVTGTITKEGVIAALSKWSTAAKKDVAYVGEQ